MCQEIEVFSSCISTRFTAMIQTFPCVTTTECSLNHRKCITGFGWSKIIFFGRGDPRGNNLYGTQLISFRISLQRGKLEYVLHVG